MRHSTHSGTLPDIDPAETQEWIAALDDVIGPNPARAELLLRRILNHARYPQIGVQSMVSTQYINTIAPEQEPYLPGDESWSGDPPVAGGTRR